MSDYDITLGAALGFEPPSDKDTSLTRGVTKAVELVAEALDQMPLLRNLKLTSDVVEQIGSFLTTPVSGLALGAWNKRGEIRKYADPEQFPPGSKNKVWLTKHELKQAVKPTVLFRLGGVPLPKLVITASVTFTFHGAMLIIEDARITQVRLGDLTAAIELSTNKAELVKRDVHKWTLPGVYRLREPIGITPPAPARPATLAG